ncbi:MAG: molybdopterin oxidoreductase [Spirochaetales bacterium]|nr:MAG: molybdopterin oxidoreductase [Spirochaetales bacterium]
MSSRTVPVSCNKDCGAGCPLTAHIEDGKITRITTSSLAEPGIKGCARGFMMHESVYSPERLLKPLVRTGERGSGSFRETSWEEAVDIVRGRLSDCLEKSGASGIMRLGGSGACRGALHNTSVLTSRFLGLLGPFTETAGNFSSQAMNFMAPFLVGTAPHGIDPKTLRFSKLIVLWGANIEDTRFGCELAPAVREAKESGTPVYVIDPRESRTVRRSGTRWLRIYPGTDAVLMCAVLHTLEAEGFLDSDFLTRYTEGFSVILDYIHGTVDGIEKSPAWASPICGLPADEIRDFARVYGAAKPAALIAGLSIQRTLGGEEACRFAVALQAATGNIGLPGGATGLRVWGALPTPYCGRIGILHDQADQPSVPVYVWADAVLDGRAKVLYNAGGNYLSQSSDIKKNIAAFHKADFSVTHDFFMTPTAYFSDVVLPVASFLERSDIMFPGMNYLLYSARAVPPIGDTKTDFEIFSLIAGRMGFEDKFTGGRTEEDWLESFLSSSEIEDKEDFKRTGIYKGRNQERVGLSDFRKDPAAAPLTTPSGRIELSSTRWEEKGLSPVPCLHIPQISEDYPLRMVTPHARYRINSQNFNMPWAGEKEAQMLLMNTTDARVRGIGDGSTAAVESPEGKLKVRVSVSEAIMPGVVSLNQGGWPRFEGSAAVPAGTAGTELNGAANILTSAVPTMPSYGSRTHSVQVQVRKDTGSP